MTHQTSSMTPCAPASCRVANCLPSRPALCEGAWMKDVSWPARMGHSVSSVCCRVADAQWPSLLSSMHLQTARPRR